MERSYKTIKKILEYIEEHHDGYSLLFIRNIDGCTFSEILYHVEIMADCGLISMVKDDSCNPRAFADKDYEKNLTWPILGLTWAGHNISRKHSSTGNLELGTRIVGALLFSGLVCPGQQGGSVLLRSPEKADVGETEK